MDNGKTLPSAESAPESDPRRREAHAHDGDETLAASLGLLTPEELALITSRKGLLELVKRERIQPALVVETCRYAVELERLQIELVKLQRSVQRQNRRVAILFEGRDAAGKGGAIRRFIEHLNPRTARVVALPSPTEVQRGQWYFQRYITTMPNPGEICFFDRSWYNRAVVEPVMGFCTHDQYRLFMQQVPEFEHMLYEDGIELIKFWFSISKEEQARRFEARKTDPLKQWKVSPVDEQAQENWDLYTTYKEQMFTRTHTDFSPWIIVKANSKRHARLESMRYVLTQLPYEGSDDASALIRPDPDVVRRYHRATRQLD